MPHPVLIAALALASTTAAIAMIAVRSARRNAQLLQAQQQANQWIAQALVEREARYHLIADHTSDLIGLLDTEGRLIYASPSYGRVLGRTPNSLIGTRYTDLLHPADTLAMRGHQHQAHPQGRTRAIYRMAHADSSWRWIEVHVRSITYAGAPMMLLIGRDITVWRTLEEQLLQAYKVVELGQLASGMVHDFNNLLTAITGNIELASITLPANHPAQRDLALAQATGARAAALVRHVSAFARHQIAQPQPLHLASVIQEFRPLLEHLIGPPIHLITQIGPDVLPIQIDPTHLMRVLMNLSLNARDAMPNGGTLTITATNLPHALGVTTAGAVSPGPVVCLTVTDTGAGMPAEVQRRLFEPFYSTKAPGQGMGLGMTIVYGIVRQTGGEITVSSSLGVGTIFTILLPGAVEAASDGT